MLKLGFKLESSSSLIKTQVNELELDDLCIVFAPSFDFDIAEGPRSSFLFKLLRSERRTRTVGCAEGSAAAVLR